MIEHFDRPAALQSDVTFTGIGIDSLVPLGRHDVDEGDLLIAERNGVTVAACQCCGATWLIGLVVQFRPLGGQPR